MKSLFIFSVFMFLPMLANADDAGSCGDGVTYVYDATSMTLTISKTGVGTGAMKEYEYSNFTPWYSYREKIMKAVIEEGVTTIGKYAFNGCTELASPTIPNSVTSIGDYAFYGCTSLTMMTIPNNVTYIGKNAFSNCNGLISVSIGNSVTYIGEYAFSSCKMTTLTIPNSVTNIGKSAFYNCSNLTSVSISDGITTIAESAFSWCGKLKTVKFPEKLELIKKEAFASCGLESITLPATTTIIYEKAFNYCKNLFEVTVLAQDPPLVMSSDAFPNYYSATLYVPEASLEKYSSTSPWSIFQNKLALPEPSKKVDTPSINIADGKIVFSCATDDVTYHWDMSIGNGSDNTGNNLPIPKSYTLRVYASKDGYQDSDAATFTISAGDVNWDGTVNVADIITVTNIIVGQ